jgi:ppGpp synthetase/RelA/SpoT-type nucleotidyltranferase
MGIELDEVFRLIKSRPSALDQTFDLVKGKPAQMGEIRVWSGVKYQKTAQGWQEVTNGKGPKQEKPGQERQPGQADVQSKGPMDAEKTPQDKVAELKGEIAKKKAVMEHHGDSKEDAPKKKDKKPKGPLRPDEDGKEEAATKELESQGMTRGDAQAVQEAGTKEVTEEEVAKHIQGYEKDFNEMGEEMDGAAKVAGATHFASRLKDTNSALKKMQGRYKGKSLDKLADIIGARALANDLTDQKKIMQALQKKYKITDVKDNSTKARPDGYRAVHVTFETPSGKSGELQIKTHLQQIFAGFAHDHIYKGDPKIKNSPEVNAYMVELSDHLHALDKGTEAGDRPKEPEILKTAGIDFPWDEINEFGKDAFAQVADQGMKYYATKRDSAKQNKVYEFESFKDAKKFKEDEIKGGHEGEIPIAYAGSQEEFLETFNEYRPENWRDLLKVREKIKRREPGKGKQVSLTGEEMETILSHGKFALISAGKNPANEEDMKLTDAQVKQRHEKLKKELKAQGYMFTPVEGKYGEVEDSFMVMAHDADKDHIIKMGKTLNQDSVIFGNQGEQEMIFTTGENSGKRHKGEGWKPETGDDNYTKVQTADGKEMKFNLNFNFDEMVKSILEYMGWNALDSLYDKIRGGSMIYEIVDSLSKGGEGSRGGNVIGHTASNKPIYGKSGSKNHKDFSKQDHLDAAQAHNTQVAQKHHASSQLGNGDGTISSKDMKKKAKLKKEIDDHYKHRNVHAEKHDPSSRTPSQKDYDKMDKKNDPDKRSRAWSRSELDSVFDLIKGGVGSGPHKKNVNGLISKIKKQRESHQIKDEDKEDHFNTSWDTAKNLFPKDQHDAIKDHVRSKLGKSDKIPGGLAEGKSPKDFDKKKMKEGAKVEKEHTSDKKVAKEIAMDHLEEDDNYYKKLKKIEKKSELDICFDLIKGEL